MGLVIGSGGFHPVRVGEDDGGDGVRTKEDGEVIWPYGGGVRSICQSFPFNNFWLGFDARKEFFQGVAVLGQFSGGLTVVIVTDVLLFYAAVVASRSRMARVFEGEGWVLCVGSLEGSKGLSLTEEELSVLCISFVAPTTPLSTLKPGEARRMALIYALLFNLCIVCWSCIAISWCSFFCP